MSRRKGEDSIESQRAQWMRDIFEKASGQIQASWQALRIPSTVVRIMKELFRGADSYIQGVREDLEQIRLRGNPEAKVDCKAGCNYCCYMEVSAGAPEIIAIKNHVETTFSDEERQALRERLRTRNAESEAMTEEEQQYASRACPFLVDGLCSIYSVRPFTCRTHHSGSVEACKKEFELEEVKIPLFAEFAESTYPIVAAHQQVFQNNGLKLEPLWFSEAMEIALTEPMVADKWCAGQDPFRKASKLAYEEKLAVKRPTGQIRILK